MGLLNNTVSNQQIFDHVRMLENQGLKGSALESAIHSAASKHGVTSGQLESSLGMKAGTVNNWTTENNQSHLTGGHGTNVFDYKDQSSTPSSVKDQFSALYGSAGVTGNANRTDKNWNDAEMQMYQLAANNGWSASDLEAQMGWSSGQVDQFTSRFGLDPLRGNQQQLPQTPTQSTTNWQNSPYSASMRSINPNTDTMQGQLNDLLRTQNPLMQRAYYQGLDMANSRGLLNSSMASEAAQAAMMDKAMPIAQNDAGTYYDQGTRNQGYTNQFNLNDRSYLQSAEQANLDRAFRSGEAGLDRAFQSGEAGLDRDLSREKMGQADSTLAQSTTANTQGKYLDAINQITQNSMTSINEIEVTPGMTQEDKDAMIANTVARRDADLAWVRQLYSNMPTWDFSWFNTQPGQMPSAPGIGV